jgi:Mg2+ and Co2+ transporter CorA
MLMCTAELKTHFFSVLLEKRAMSLEAIEKETGMSHGFSDDPKRNRRLDANRQQELAKLDFEPITQKLTGLMGTLAFCHLTFEASRQDLDLIVATARRISIARTSHKSKILDNTRPDPDQRANYLRNLISGGQAHQGVLLERTKAQVQTVYSMIGQRDNKLNIETAIAARRDSNAMRIIAAVTLVFLPGTFTATLFSTTFFNFQYQSSRIVSSWLWLYFVVTVFLTLAVVAGWYYLEKRQNRTIWQSLNIASAEPLVNRDEEAAMMSEKEFNAQPTSGVAVRGSSRVVEVRAYTQNDLDTRLWMNGVPTGWHGHY